jgi:hypothetical protein
MERTIALGEHSFGPGLQRTFWSVAQVVIRLWNKVDSRVQDDYEEYGVATMTRFLALVERHLRQALELRRGAEDIPCLELDNFARRHRRLSSPPLRFLITISAGYQDGRGCPGLYNDLYWHQLDPVDQASIRKLNERLDSWLAAREGGPLQDADNKSVHQSQPDSVVSAAAPAYVDGRTTTMEDTIINEVDKETRPGGRLKQLVNTSTQAMLTSFSRTGSTSSHPLPPPLPLHAPAGSVQPTQSGSANLWPPSQ